MPEYNLGNLTVISHDVERLTEAFDIPEDRFEDLIDLAQHAWYNKETISESIEFIAQNVKDSELVLGLVLLGRVWEVNEKDNEEDNE